MFLVWAVANFTAALLIVRDYPTLAFVNTSIGILCLVAGGIDLVKR